MTPFSFDHTGRKVVITGGGSGLGRGMALAFAARGARVLICGRREEKLKETAALNPGPGTIAASAADVTRDKDMQRLAAKAVETLGGIDVWVNNAGVLERGTLPGASPEHVRRLMEINVDGVFNGCRAAVGVMKDAGAGVILNISSYLSEHAGATGTLAAYAATKGAINALTRTMAVRHGPDNIRVNAVCPALVPTELNPDIYDGFEDREARNKELGKRYPLRRIGIPEDVAGAVLYLASDEAAWVSGQALFVDGGLSAE